MSNKRFTDLPIASGINNADIIAIVQANVSKQITAEKLLSPTNVKINANTSSIGTLSSLTTTAKGNLVLAINEVKETTRTNKALIDTNKTSIGTLNSLATTAKSNLVLAINEVKGTAGTNKTLIDANKTSIGTLASLTTTAKGNLVAAINEVKGASTANKTLIDTNKAAIGTLTALTTTAKGSLVLAINELKAGGIDLTPIRNYFIKTGTTAPTTKPDFVGQTYINTTAKKKYEAFGTTTVSDWVEVLTARNIVE